MSKSSLPLDRPDYSYSFTLLSQAPSLSYNLPHYLSLRISCFPLILPPLLNFLLLSPAPPVAFHRPLYQKRSNIQSIVFVSVQQYFTPDCMDSTEPVLQSLHNLPQCHIRIPDTVYHSATTQELHCYSVPLFLTTRLAWSASLLERWWGGGVNTQINHGLAEGMYCT